jgi:hypothetical protein
LITQTNTPDALPGAPLLVSRGQPGHNILTLTPF